MATVALNNANQVVAPLIATGSRFVRDAREDFPVALMKIGLATSGAAVCGAFQLTAGPEPAEGVEGAKTRALAGSFFCGLATMGCGFALGVAGRPLSRAKKVIILSLASLPLSVAMGVAGSGCVKLVSSILGAPI